MAKFKIGDRIRTRFDLYDSDAQQNIMSADTLAIITDVREFSSYSMCELSVCPRKWYHEINLEHFKSQSICKDCRDTGVITLLTSTRPCKLCREKVNENTTM